MWVQLELPFDDNVIDNGYGTSPKQVAYNERCKALEDAYYAGDKNALGLLYLEIKTQALMVIKIKRIKYGFFLSADDIKNKAEDAATNMIMRYYKKPGFRFRGFARYTDLVCKQQLWHRRKCDKINDIVPHETVTAMYNAERMRKVKVYVRTNDTQRKNKVSKNKKVARVYRCVLKRKSKVCILREQGNECSPQD